jgi:hypothetical protein
MQPERFGERSFQHVDPIHGAVALSDPGASSVQADGVHLVGIRDRAIALGEITYAIDQRNIAIHGIKRLKSDQLWTRHTRLAQQLLEVVDVIVVLDPFLASRLTDAFDH